jgi:hypothetical protein
MDTFGVSRVITIPDSGSIPIAEPVVEADRSCVLSRLSNDDFPICICMGGRSFSALKLICMKMVSTPFTADDQVNPVEALTMILKAALMMDPNAHIMSNDPTCSPIDKISDIAKISNIDKYAVDLQTNAIKKQFVYFVTLETTVSFHNLKFNKELYAWLKENKHFLVQNTMKTNYTAAIGYFMGMHPTLSSRDAMKGTLDGYIPSDIDYNLITVSTFYIDQKGKKVNTHVVEIHVDAK